LLILETPIKYKIYVVCGEWSIRASHGKPIKRFNLDKKMENNHIFDPANV
jgi:hypothetical protein